MGPHAVDRVLVLAPESSVFETVDKSDESVVDSHLVSVALLKVVDTSSEM